MNIKYPLQYNNNGRTGETTDDQHIRDMIEQILFTAPGERVNRPDFGSGLLQIVFEPNSDELVTTTQFLVQGSLQHWLGDMIEVKDVEVNNEDSKIIVTVVYIVRSNMETVVAKFTR